MQELLQIDDDWGMDGRGLIKIHKMEFLHKGPWSVIRLLSGNESSSHNTKDLSLCDEDHVRVAICNFTRIVRRSLEAWELFEKAL